MEWLPLDNENRKDEDNEKAANSDDILAKLERGENPIPPKMFNLKEDYRGLRGLPYAPPPMNGSIKY